MPADATEGFSAEERAAMKERLREQRAASRRTKPQSPEAGEQEVLAKIAEMPEPDRALAERVHTIVRAAAPQLVPRTWYGMPAYSKDGDVVCFFQPASKFKARYATLGFSDKANLDDGEMWPTSFAIARLTAADEARMVALVTQAVT
jgi:uncharacterized protein YdhG (YjbR/CyaY superfamily)